MNCDSVENLPFIVQSIIIHYYLNDNSGTIDNRDKLKIALVSWRYHQLVSSYWTRVSEIDSLVELKQHIDNRYCVLKTVKSLVVDRSFEPPPPSPPTSGDEDGDEDGGDDDGFKEFERKLVDQLESYSFMLLCYHQRESRYLDEMSLFLSKLHNLKSLTIRDDPVEPIGVDYYDVINGVPEPNNLEELNFIGSNINMDYIDVEYLFSKLDQTKLQKLSYVLNGEDSVDDLMDALFNGGDHDDDGDEENEEKQQRYFNNISTLKLDHYCYEMENHDQEYLESLYSDHLSNSQEFGKLVHFQHLAQEVPKELILALVTRNQNIRSIHVPYSIFPINELASHEERNGHPSLRNITTLNWKEKVLISKDLFPKFNHLKIHVWSTSKKEIIAIDPHSDIPYLDLTHFSKPDVFIDYLKNNHSTRRLKIQYHKETLSAIKEYNHTIKHIEIMDLGTFSMGDDDDVKAFLESVANDTIETIIMHAHFQNQHGISTTIGGFTLCSCTSNNVYTFEKALDRLI